MSCSRDDRLDVAGENLSDWKMSSSDNSIAHDMLQVGTASNGEESLSHVLRTFLTIVVKAATHHPHWFASRKRLRILDVLPSLKVLHELAHVNSGLHPHVLWASFPY